MTTLNRQLTLKMLSCFKDHKRCIHISCHLFDFVQQKKTRFAMEQPHMLPILYCQYHVCWCSGDFRSQGISKHGIDPQSWNIPSSASEELTFILKDPRVSRKESNEILWCHRMEQHTTPYQKWMQLVIHVIVLIYINSLRLSYAYRYMRQ